VIRSQLFSAVESGTPAERQRVLGVIPARLNSTRLPRKMLREIAGEPMLAWVYRAARACSQLDQVLIATDADEIMQLAQRYGFPAIFTPADCASGTDRVHVVSQAIAADIYVNIQGDEPLLRPEHLEALLAPMLTPTPAPILPATANARKSPPTPVEAHTIEVATLATPCPPEQVHSPHAVKVVATTEGRALYFSRAAIPFDRDGVLTEDPGGDSPTGYWKHLGIYAYRKRALDRFPTLAPSRLEAVEKLEQLRYLENGFHIHVSPTPYDTRGVDTEEDLLAVEALLAERQHG
jgi:3-deoxy-manno-octulosonate cytidylyltransferase (CMP-KDO synthetase)